MNKIEERSIIKRRINIHIMWTFFTYDSKIKLCFLSPRRRRNSCFSTNTRKQKLNRQLDLDRKFWLFCLFVCLFVNLFETFYHSLDAISEGKKS